MEPLPLNGGVSREASFAVVKCVRGVLYFRYMIVYCDICRYRK